MPKHITISAVVLLMIFAVVQRVPYMSNDLKSWQVGNTNMLTTLEIWNLEGCANHHFSPVQTWPNKGDKFHHAYKRLETPAGNNYYVSLPPLTWWLAHVVFNTIGHAPSNYGLQVIGFILQIIGAFFVFALLIQYCRSALAALIGFAAFLYSPVLFFGYNYYLFSEIVGLTFWIITAYFALMALQTDQAKWRWLLFFSNLFFVLTCWTGVLFTACAALLFLFRKKKRTAAIITVSLLTGITLMVIIYSSIAGFEALQHAWSIRFLERSGLFGNDLSDQGFSFYNAASYRALGVQFLHQMQWLGYATLLTLILATAWAKQTRTKWINTSNITRHPLIWLFVLPCILHTLVFFNANVLHYVYQGKWGLLTAIVAGWAIYRMTTFSSKLPLRIGLTILLIGLSLSITHEVPKDKDGEELKALASELMENIDPNKPVFIQGGSNLNTLYLSYLLKRNVVATEEDSAPDNN